MNNMENQDKAPEEEKKQISDIVVNDTSDALNVLVGFIHLAQRRGVFNVEESAKIWECINMFKKK